ncbi:MAG: Glycerophosphoryl diester phosphodiesterase [Thermoleophilia bacterium]|nr:Glycerophosphoryl diester phosphodiesterase [Thermoleophilia bacterium]
MSWTSGIGSSPLVVAHRGYHPVDGPSENSLGAFQAAIDIGADVVESDIRRTKDGVLVLHHDAEFADGRTIADLTYAELPLLPDGQRVPRLTEAADLMRRTGARFAPELKEGGYERQVVTELAAHMPLSQVELISFDRTAIKEVESIDPSIVTGLLEPHLPVWLRDSALYPAALWVMDKLNWHPSLSAAAKVGADYVSVEHRMASEKFIAEAHERGFAVHAWTVDDPVRMAELSNDGVDALVTNRSDLALGTRPQQLATAPALPAA